MGDMLTKPETQKFSTVYETSCLHVGCCSMQGWRKSMEDAHLIELNIENNKCSALFGIFDGHQSDEAARYCRSHLFNLTMNNLSSNDFHKSGSEENRNDGEIIDYDKLFEETFKQLDDEICHKYMSSGTAANCVLLHQGNIVCANVGDSRAVLCRSNEVIPLSHDHKPYIAEEKERIEKAGGHVENDRINMTLAVSRALGDVDFKQNDELSWKEQVVTAHPDVEVIESQSSDKFIVLACDGVWDVLNNQQCCTLIEELIKENTVAREGNVTEVDLSLVCEQILDRCLAKTNTVREGTDNMTIVIVLFKKAFFK